LKVNVEMDKKTVCSRDVKILKKEVTDQNEKSTGKFYASAFTLLNRRRFLIQFNHR
jgi:hypothetical protein